MKKFLYCTLMTGLLAPLVHGQQRQDELVANEELDSFAIAEQLYLQTRSDKVDPAGRAAMLNRAAELFGRFTAKFPKSPLPCPALPSSITTCSPFLRAESGLSIALAHCAFGCLAHGLHLCPSRVLTFPVSTLLPS